MFLWFFSSIYRRSLRSDVREVLNEILSTSDPTSDVHFFNISNARHLIFPTIQHATDNQTLRDSMFLDLALEKVQSDLTLGFLSSVFPRSLNACSQNTGTLANDVPTLHDVPNFTATSSILPKPTVAHSSSCEMGLDLLRSLMCLPPAIPSPLPILEDPILDASLSDHNNNETSPSVSFASKHPLDTPISIISRTENFLINPLYLCKEMLACLVTSLLAMQVRFSEIDAIHADFCSLLIQPAGSSKWGYGFPVFESMAKLREKTLLNASVEHTQFARGFYQTQAQRKTAKKSRHFPSPSRTASSPFMIPSVVSLPQNTKLLHSPDVPILPCPCDADSTVPPTTTSSSNRSLGKSLPRPRFTSDISPPFISSGIDHPGSIHQQASGLTASSCQFGLFDMSSSSCLINPTSMFTLNSRLVDLSLLKKHIDEDPKLYLALLFMRSIAERLDRYVLTLVCK